MNPIKILLFATILIGLIFVAQLVLPPSIKQSILDFLATQVAPKLPFYTFIKEEILQGTLKGLAVYVAFANIPLLPNPPVEPYVIYMFTKGTNPIFIVLTVTGVTIITSSIAYFLGFIFGPNLIEKLTKKPFRYSERMDFLSAPITFIEHLLPIPNVFPFIFGAYHSNYRNFLIASILGTIIRFSLLLFLFHNYSSAILQVPIIKQLFS